MLGLHWRGVRHVLASVAVAAVVLTPRGDAAPESSAWLEATVLTHSVVLAQLGVDAAGRTVAVWTEREGERTLVRSATRPALARWSRAATIRSTEQGIPYLDFAANGVGDGLAVWMESNTAGSSVVAATRSTSGAFASPRTLADGAQSPPRAAVGADGTAVAVWANAQRDVLAAFQQRHGRWTQPRKIGTDALWPAVAVGGNGMVIVTWVGAGRVFAATSRSGNRFGKPVAVSASNDACFAPTVAANARGDAVVLWSSSRTKTFQGAFRPTGRTKFGPEETIGTSGGDCGAPQAFVDRSGVTTALLGLNHNTRFPLQAATRPLRGSFSEPQTLANDVDSSALAGNANGNVIAVWSRWGGDYVVEAARKPQGARSFGDPVELSPRGYNARVHDVGIDRGGRAVAVWTRSSGSRFALEARATAGRAGGAPVAPAATAGWRSPAILSDPTGVAVAPDAAPLGADRTIAAWSELQIFGRVGRVGLAVKNGDGRWQRDYAPGCGRPDLDANAAGDAIVVYSCGGSVRARSLRRGGAFGPEETVAAGASVGAGLDRDGNAVVALVSSSGTLQFTRRAATGVWGSVQSATDVGSTFGITLAVNGAGEAVAAWTSPVAAEFVVNVAFRTAGGAIELGSLGTGSDPVVGLDDDGVSTVMWRGTGNRLVSRVYVRGGAMDDAQLLAESPSGQSALAVGSSGDAVAVWSADGRITAAVRARGSTTWEPGRALSSAAADFGWAPVAAVDARGDAVVAWRPSIGVLKAVVRTAGGAFGEPEDVSQAGVDALGPRVAIGSTGRVVAGWLIRRGQSNRWLATGVSGVAERP